MSLFVDRSDRVFHSPTFESVLEEAVEFVESCPPHSLPPPDKFIGPGVYLLYYTGDFEPYRPVAEANQPELRQPIYAGKAVPKGWRKGREPDSDELSDKLHQRLREHARSIRDVENLNIDNFACRFAIFKGEEMDMIGTVENALIRRFEPIWNKVVDGFGNHHPGKNRLDQLLAEWDALHPGRSWEQEWRGDQPDRQRIIQKIENFLR